MTTKRTAKKSRNAHLIERLEEGAALVSRLRQMVKGQMDIINILQIQRDDAIAARDIARRCAATLEQECARQLTVLRIAHQALTLDLGKELALVDVTDALTSAEVAA